MKKIIILLLIVVISTPLACKSFLSNLIPNEINMSYNGINVENGVKFYVLESEIYNDNLYTRINHTFTDSVIYKSHEYRISYLYKFIFGRARWQRNDFVDLNLYSLDLRGVFKGWNAGIMQAWDPNPETYFIFGKEFKLSLNFFAIPGFIYTTSDFMTYNFRKWYSENSVKLKLHTEIEIIENIINVLGGEANIPSISLHAQYRIKDYGKVISEILFGFGIDF